ncbi:MAG: GDP-mannose mannosyl hydrolase [Halorientalis sp.]
MAEDKPIPDEAWATIVENVPLVSVDLVVETEEGVVLGKRENEPAKGEWFVPGGTVHKHEQLTEAVHRVAGDELGIPVTIERQLGVYEHFYDVADVAEAGGKHYVPIGYHVRPAGEVDLRADDQHGALEVFAEPFADLDLHPYVEAYLVDAGIAPKQI